MDVIQKFGDYVKCFFNLHYFTLHSGAINLHYNNRIYQLEFIS